MRNLSVIKGLYQGNGVTRRWAIPFEYNDTAQIFVTITTFDEGDYTYRVLDRTEYTIDEDSVEIVYPKTDDDAPIPSTQYLTVWRDTDLLQLMDLTNQGAAWPDSIEASLDKLHQIVQELAEGLSRSLKVDIGDPQTPDEKLVAIQDYVLAAAESSRSASASEASAQRAAEAAATSEANAAESERLASGYADTAADGTSRGEDSAISARAYNAPDYDNETTYQAGDVVTFTDGNSYRALQETTGNEPPNIIYWQKVTDYVGDDFFEVDEYGYIVPMDSPSHSRYWRVDQNGYIVPIEGGDGGYRPDTRQLSAEYLNVTNEGYAKHLRADDINAQEVDADEMTAEVAAFNTLTANAVNAQSASVTEISAGTVTANDIIAKGPWVDVRAYGAKGDGVTDDTQAIQAAIDYAADIAITARVEFNKAVVFPTGDYLVTDTITVPATITIIPIGNVCIRFHAQTQESVCFSVLALSKDAKTQTQGMALFSDSLGSLCIAGWGTGQGLGIGIRLTYDDRYTNPCTVKIAGVICDWLYIGIKVDYVNQYFTQIERCVLRFCITGLQIADADIQISNSGERFTIKDSVISRCRAGVYNVKAAVILFFAHCSIDFCTVCVYGESAARYAQYNFLQCHIEGMGESALSGDNFHGARGLIYNNSASDNKGSASFEQCFVYLYGDKRPDVLIHGVGRIDLSDVRYTEVNHIETVGRGINSNLCLTDNTCTYQTAKNIHTTVNDSPLLYAPCYAVMPAFFTADDASVTIALNAVLSDFTVTKLVNGNGAVIQSALYDNKYVLQFTSTNNGYIYLTQNKYQRIKGNRFGGIITAVLPSGLSVSNIGVTLNVVFYDENKTVIPYSSTNDRYLVARIPPSIDEVKTAMDNNVGKVISSYVQDSYGFKVPDNAFYYKAQIVASITGNNKSIKIGGFYLFFYD